MTTAFDDQSVGIRALLDVTFAELVEVAAEYNAGRIHQGAEAMADWYRRLADLDETLKDQMLAKALWSAAVMQAHSDRAAFDDEVSALVSDSYVGKRRLHDGHCGDECKQCRRGGAR